MRQVTGRRAISVRRVDVNKGDDVHPNYRSHLVARQIMAAGKSGETYFAPAPPPEALRTVLSLAVTSCGDHAPCPDPSSPERTQVSRLDEKRDYFNAEVDSDATPICVLLPIEDPDHGAICGQLLRHMYGTRMAADGWHEEYSFSLSAQAFGRAWRARMYYTTVRGVSIARCTATTSPLWAVRISWIGLKPR